MCIRATDATSAAKALRNNQAEVAICWDGGRYARDISTRVCSMKCETELCRHHAQKSRASGFCYVADCVLAILTLKRPIPASPSPLKPRVMYLDLDLHFSDGVSQAFHSIASASSSPQVLTFSIHHAAPGFFPVSEHSGLSDPASPSFDPFALSLPLERGASNTTFARVWPIIERVKDAFRPDYVVVQCGVDGLAGDPYATWNWSLGGGDGSLGWYIDRICRWGCKTLLLGGGMSFIGFILRLPNLDIVLPGGYNSPNVARAWTYFTSIAVSTPSAIIRRGCCINISYCFAARSPPFSRSRHP